jgi:hypothetical protein
MKSHITGSTNIPPSTSATQYAAPTSNDNNSWTGSENQRSAVVPHAMTIDQLRVILTTAPGGVTSYAFTVMVNGVASAITCTITGAALTIQDLGHTASLNAGDLISLRSVPSGTPASTGIIYWTIRADGGANKFASIGSNTGMPTATGTLYTTPMGRGLTSGTDVLGAIIVPTAGDFTNLYAAVPNALGAAKSYAFTVMKNGVAQTTTATISGASAVSANDTAHSFSVVAGDTVSIQIVTAGVVSSSNGSYSLTFAPTNDGESFLCYSANGNSPSNTVANYNAPYGSNSTWSATENTKWTRLGATTVKAIYADTSVSPGVSPAQYTLTMDDNSVATAAAVTINDASSTHASDRWAGTTGLSVAVAADDPIAIKSVPANSPGGVFIKTSLLCYISPVAASTPVIPRFLQALQAINRAGSF